MQFLYNQLVYFAFLQSLFLLVIYGFSGKIRKAVNPYLVVLIVILAIGLVGRILSGLDLLKESYRLIGFSEYAIFFFGATVYLFTKSSLSEKKARLSDLIHYLPGLIYILVISQYYVFASSQSISERVQSGALFWAVVWFMGLGLLFNGTYWVMSYRLFIAHQKQLMYEVSFSVQSRFFRNFLWAIGLCLLVWLIIYLLGVFGESWMERDARPAIWMALAFLILFIAFYSIREPELFKIGTKVKREKYTRSKLSHNELDHLRIQLEQIMEEKKPYLNRHLLKADLAEMLGVNNPEVARLLNEKIGMNFFEYINLFRIKEFIALAKKEEAKTLTFFGLAQEAGFNSKTTFNKSFKKIMGTSPKKYFAQKMESS